MATGSLQTIYTEPLFTITTTQDFIIPTAINTPVAVSVTNTAMFNIGSYVYVRNELGNKYGTFKITALTIDTISLSLDSLSHKSGTGTMALGSKITPSAKPASGSGSGVWGDIDGTLSDQEDLNNILSRIRRYTTTTSVFTIPGIGGTSTVDVDDPQGFDSNVSIAIADGMGEYTQVTITSVSGNTLTVERDATGINTATGSTFPIGSFVTISLTAESIYGVVGLPSISNSVFDQDNDGIVDVATSIEGIDTAGNSKYYGTNASGTAGFYDLPTGSSSVSTYGSFFAASPTVKNIPLFTATRATTINELRGVKTASGTATVSIQVGGVNVTGLTNLSITSSPQNFTASGGNTVSVGTRVTVNITAVSSAVDLEFTMGATLS